MKKILVIFLSLLFSCQIAPAQNLKYDYKNNRATIYNALNLTDSQIQKREEILNENAKILDGKYQKLEKESYKLSALKKGNACYSEIIEQKKIIKNIQKEIEKIQKAEGKKFKKCLTFEQKSKYKIIEKLQKHDTKKEISHEKLYKANPQMTEFARPKTNTCKS